MNLSELLLEKLEGGYIVKICMNSMRVKMCSFRYQQESLFPGLEGHGDGSTALGAIKAALKSFDQGYKGSGYWSGDTESYNILDKFVHSGYNIYFWIDSGLVIFQIRDDNFCPIPARVLLELESAETVCWQIEGRQYTTKRGELDVMHNHNCPNLNTYMTTECDGKREITHHHFFKRLTRGSRHLGEILPLALLEGGGPTQ